MIVDNDEPPYGEKITHLLAVVPCAFFRPHCGRRPKG